MSERDPVVAAALTALDVPPHRPGFWVDLDRAIDDLPVDALPADELPVDPLPDTSIEPADNPIEPADETDPESPPRPSRARFALRLLGAAAAIAIVLGAGAVLARDDSGGGPDLSAPDPAAEDGAADPGAGGGAADAVVQWVDALGGGDLAAAAALMGAQSEAYAIALDGTVEAHLQTGYTEGYGAWASSTDRVVTVHEIDPGAAVVVLRGTRQAEGTVEAGVVAIPVRKADSADEWFVEPNAFDPDIESQRLEYIGEQPTPGAALEVGIGVAGTMYFWLGDSEPTAVPTTAGDLGDTATWTMPDTAAPGDLLVIAFVSDTATTFTALAAVL